MSNQPCIIIILFSPKGGNINTIIAKSKRERKEPMFLKTGEEQGKQHKTGVEGKNERGRPSDGQDYA